MGYQEVECATFHRTPPLGVLQISSTRNKSGPITNVDLQEFAAECIAAGIQVNNVAYKAVSGLKRMVAWSRKHCDLYHL